MTKKIFSWLSFMTVFSFLLYSCVQDEMYSASDTTSNEYHSKSLWKEDEKYIKNVMKIYAEHESEIKKIDGTPVWDYAMSMGRYDETFMAVPIVKNNTVINTLVCARFDKKVYFRYENSQRNNEFFNNIIFGKYTKYKTEPHENNGQSSTQKGVICSTSAMSMWYPDNENDTNGSGHWETNYYTNCYAYQDYYDPSWETGGGGGYEYGDNSSGGGDPDPGNDNFFQSPCEKLQNQKENPQFAGKIQTLVGNLGLHGETGFIEKTGGIFEYKNITSTNPDSNSLTLGHPTPDMQGYMHTHSNNFTVVNEQGYEEERIGFKIFSPADVIYFNQLVALAQQNGKSLDEIYAVMVSGTGTYQLRFTGNINQIKTVYTNTKEEYNEMYKKYFQENDDVSDELNFLKFMEEKMYVKGVSLVKMNSNGTFTTKKLNPDKSGVADSDCP